jgi:cytochrome c-type biogenesis protein CcmH/NrfF
VVGVVVVIALVIGSGATRGETSDDRMMAVAATIKCPECADQSSATSGAPTAVAIRAQIKVMLAHGESPDDIRGHYAAEYGEQILLDPARSGAASLVWMLPVFCLVVAFGGLGVVFARWRAMDVVPASDADRALVAEAQGRASGTAESEEPEGEPELVEVDAHGEGDGA